MRYIRRNQVVGLTVARGSVFMPRRISAFFFYTCLAILISACSLESSTSQQAASPPPLAGTDQATASLPAEKTVMDSFRALAPPEGLKFTSLFSEPLKDNDARIERLENTVQTMRNDFDTVMPTMVRMAAIEKDIKNLVTQLQTLTDEGAEAVPPAPVPSLPFEAETAPVLETKTPPPAPAAETAPPAVEPTTPIPLEPASAKPIPGAEKTTPAVEPAVVSPPVTPEAAPTGNKPPEGAASTGSISLVNALGLRIADHTGETRIVLDMAGSADVEARLENGGKTLVIPLTGLNWLGKQSWTNKGASLVSGYHVEGDKVFIDLLHVAYIQSQTTMTPEGAYKNHRLVIDLISQ